jgi:predicted RNA-binding Zn ribbon-like protein
MPDDTFLWVGNHPGLDLCNTRPVIAGAPAELLASSTAVVSWARAAGIGSGHWSSALDDPGLARWARALREGLRGVLDPTDGTAHARRDLNAVLRSTSAHLWLPRAGDRCELRTDREERQLRLDIAVAALDALALDRARVRRCADPRCVLLFVDTSKAGRRRWCDMATCGNRAKASAHSARRRT